MSKLLEVAESIMEQDEFFESILESYETVRDYGFDAFEPSIKLTKHEAELVRQVCLKMVERLNSGDIPGSHSWYEDFKRLLMNEEDIPQGL